MPFIFYEILRWWDYFGYLDTWALTACVTTNAWCNRKVKNNQEWCPAIKIDDPLKLSILFQAYVNMWSGIVMVKFQNFGTTIWSLLL